MRTKNMIAALDCDKNCLANVTFLASTLDPIKTI
jgi:hypothetical protein